jgi:hypothetical protein
MIAAGNRTIRMPICGSFCCRPVLTFSSGLSECTRHEGYGSLVFMELTPNQLDVALVGFRAISNAAVNPRGVLIGSNTESNGFPLTTVFQIDGILRE